MQADLAEALIPVKWAEAQLPILQRRFRTWRERNPYCLFTEPDPDSSDWELIFAKLDAPIDEVIIGDVGAIVNSIRSALNLLMAAVVARHGVIPERAPDFPIVAKGTALDFEGAVKGLESKHGLSAAEVGAIKSTKAYPDGNRALPLPHLAILDNMRKHQRLIKVEPLINEILFRTGFIPAFIRLEDKTIVGRTRRGHGATLAEGDIEVTPVICLYDAPGGIGTKEAIPTLAFYAERVRRFVETFP